MPYFIAPIASYVSTLFVGYGAAYGLMAYAVTTIALNVAIGTAEFTDEDGNEWVATTTVLDDPHQDHAGHS